MPQLHICDSLRDISPQQWNALAGDDNPFIQYETLRALETGNCLYDYGWQPRYFLLTDNKGRLIGAMPAYEKYNSYGEFVFDWAWADAWQRAGLRYYPKLVISIPYSPCQGPRILALNREASIKSSLIKAAIQFAEKSNYSSVHWLFPDQDDFTVLQQHTPLQRFDYQFHWHNHNYNSFDDFLAQLTSKKRKNIKQERRKVREQNIDIQILNGTELSSEQWNTIYRFYQITFMKKSGSPTLSLDFFKQIAEKLLIIFAEHHQQTVAGAIFIRGRNTLYGRHWGCFEDYKGLHFEVCYYAGIEYCIRHKIKTFEPGAQGEHKIPRGFLPVKTRSAHWVAEPEFERILATHLQQEAAAMEDYGQQLMAASPFKNS